LEAEQYRVMGVPDEKIAMIPNGIDLSEYANLPPKGAFRKKFFIDDNEKIALYLGRIHRIKGIDVLLKAFSHIAKTSEDAKLAVVGPDDGYLSVCKDLAKRLNLEGKVLFTGPLYGKAKLEAYVDADVFALPSRYEIFGNVILESYACYKPVVATRVGGLQEIVFDGTTGLLVESGDVKGLASGIFTLLTDDRTRITMGMRARRVVEEKFSIEKIADKLEATYSEILRT
jgi:glycosyltransferase involved in cell wall biosynthesis